jgi:hypothetical protein
MTLKTVLEEEEWVRRLVFGLLSIGGDTENLNNAVAMILNRSAPTDAAEDQSIRAELSVLANRIRDKDHFQVLEVVFERVAEAHGGISTSEGRTLDATQLARGKKLDAVRDEGRRALAAEIEFQKGESKMAARDYDGVLLCFRKAMGKFPSEGEYRSH